MNRVAEPALTLISKIDITLPEKIVLDNGIPVFVLNAGEQEVTKLDIVFRAGDWYGEFSTLAANVNELLDSGTAKRTAYEISQSFDQYGAYLNTTCNFDTASVKLFTLSRFIPETFSLLLEIISEAIFPDEEVKILRDQSIQQLKINSQKVNYISRNNFNKMLFPGDHPYGRSSSVADYQKLNSADLLLWHNQYYQPQNCLIFLSGRFNEDAIKSLNQIFGKWKDTSPGKVIEKNFSVENYKPEKKYIEKNDALQTAIRIGCHAPNKLHPDYIPLTVLSTVLGGYFGSRLMSNLREERGYTYGVGCTLVSWLHDGYFLISTQVGKQHRERAIEQIYLEIKRLLEEKISDNELNRVKNYMTGVYQRSLDGPMLVSDRIRSTVLYNQDFNVLNTYLQIMNSTNSDQLIELANRYFSNEMTEVSVG